MLANVGWCWERCKVVPVVRVIHPLYYLEVLAQGVTFPMVIGIHRIRALLRGPCHCACHAKYMESRLFICCFWSDVCVLFSLRRIYHCTQTLNVRTKFQQTIWINHLKCLNQKVSYCWHHFGQAQKDYTTPLSPVTQRPVLGKVLTKSSVVTAISDTVLRGRVSSVWASFDMRYVNVEPAVFLFIFGNGLLDVPIR